VFGVFGIEFHWSRSCCANSASGHARVGRVAPQVRNGIVAVFETIPHHWGRRAAREWPGVGPQGGGDAKVGRGPSVPANAMQQTTQYPFGDSDLVGESDSVKTLPAEALLEPSDSDPPHDIWDDEATTVVHVRRPVFARPPRLPAL
jgi:hypothetical protein